MLALRMRTKDLEKLLRRHHELVQFVEEDVAARRFFMPFRGGLGGFRGFWKGVGQKFDVIEADRGRVW